MKKATSYLRRLLWMVTSTVLYAQDPAVVMGIGYVPPAVPIVAAGQIVTLYVDGLTAPDVQASAPLPLELAGVRAVLRLPALGYEKAMPILRIQSLDCGRASDGQPLICQTRALTVQVPTNIPAQYSPGDSVTVYQNGVAGYTARIGIQPARPTLLNTCMAFLQPSPVAVTPTTSCPSLFSGNLITRANGTLLSKDNPARGGEAVVLYFTGLGATIPVVPEGESSPPAPAILAEQLTAEVGGASAAVEFAGLTPGSVGLYQVNVRLPATLPPSPTSVENGVYTVSARLLMPGNTVGGIQLYVIW